MDNQNNKNKPNPNNKNNKQGFSFVILVAVITSILVLALYQFQGGGAEKEISYDKFLRLVKTGHVEEVEIENDKILIKTKEMKDKDGKEQPSRK